MGLGRGIDSLMDTRDKVRDIICHHCDSMFCAKRYTDVRCVKLNSMVDKIMEVMRDEVRAEANKQEKTTQQEKQAFNTKS